MKFLTMILLLTVLSLLGCEDDPILTPSSDSEEECTGSYCRLQLIPQQLFSIPTRNAFHWIQDSSNPEVF